MVFFQAPEVDVRLPRSVSPLFTIRGPLTQEGTLDDSRLAQDIGTQLELDGKVALTWMSSELGVLTHNGAPTVTVRVL